MCEKFLQFLSDMTTPASLLNKVFDAEMGLRYVRNPHKALLKI